MNTHTAEASRQNDYAIVSIIILVQLNRYPLKRMGKNKKVFKWIRVGQKCQIDQHKTKVLNTGLMDYKICNIHCISVNRLKGESYKQSVKQDITHKKRI